MAKDKEKDKKVSVEEIKDSKPALSGSGEEQETELHLDDFLNHMERVDGRRELLAAFAAKHKQSGFVKRPLSLWMQAFREFEKEIP